MHLILLGQEAGFWLFNNHSQNCQIFKNQTFLQKYCKGFLKHFWTFNQNRNVLWLLHKKVEH